MEYLAIIQRKVIELPILRSDDLFLPKGQLSGGKLSPGVESGLLQIKY